MKAQFNALRKIGCTVSQVNKSIKFAKAVFAYAFDSVALDLRQPRACQR
jgi:hypothetical protein